MSDDEKPSGHPSAHNVRQTPNKPPSPAEKGPFSATYPAEADLSYDVVAYGPDVGTDDDYRLIGDLEGKRVLDLGCGAGHAAITMARQGAHVIAVDPSNDNLARLREAAEQHEIRVESHQSDLADLAFVRADSIDLVFSAYSLATVPDVSRVFRQAHRVLRPELHIVLSLPHPAFSMVDPASNDPMRIRRTYWDDTPREWTIDSRTGADHPQTVAQVFTQLTRSNFRVDTLIEPEPADDASSPYHSEISRWVPATLIVRARKEGI
jgi:ubiquinone/menaquinone biosynthesis C-methylase UbiE